MIGQVDEEAGENGLKKKKKRRSYYEVRSVDDITKEDLDNIAYRSKDKIWDKENVSHIYPFSGPPYYTVRFPVLIRFFTVYMCACYSFRAARVTSADRRLWTPRRCVAAVSV